jgi:hypothetical protein
VPRVREENISGFDVAVDNPTGVKEVKGDNLRRRVSSCAKRVKGTGPTNSAM